MFGGPLLDANFWGTRDGGPFVSFNRGGGLESPISMTSYFLVGLGKHGR